MLKLWPQLLSATWLLWLYSNTPIWSIATGQTERSPFLATLQPVQTGLNTMSTTMQWIQPLITPSPPVDPDRARLEVHLRRRRVVLYRGNLEMRSYPIAIGQAGWETPTGQFQVLHMEEKPIWIHPLTNQVVPHEDLRNPLGRYWIGFWTDGHNWVGFHGTPHPNSVGQALSHGCLRMHDADIDELYYQVSTGTPVSVKP
ncbi:MAG: L,D-transpeptidase [Leptolyngbyaceae cyanobacterium bins.349]|nr:L,D-transpeptidase [Leptolyngbyaceae cyanobacterium bins.349]